jgi:hypothetical protein
MPFHVLMLPGLGPPCLHLHRDCAHPSPPAAPGLRSPLSHLRRDCARPSHISAPGLGLPPLTSAPGLTTPQVNVSKENPELRMIVEAKLREADIKPPSRPVSRPGSERALSERSGPGDGHFVVHPEYPMYSLWMPGCGSHAGTGSSIPRDLCLASPCCMCPTRHGNPTQGMAWQARETRSALRARQCPSHPMSRPPLADQVVPAGRPPAAPGRPPAALAFPDSVDAHGSSCGGILLRSEPSNFE